MINYIELKNWKTHKSTHLSFDRGSNILIGQMGAGKSSIMDAISYALFGKFPAIQQRRTSVSGLITSRPKKMDGASVKLGFTVDNDTYTVERTISSDGGSKATLEKNGAYLHSQPVRVTEEIERIMKVDYDLFSKAVYSEQNRLDYFLEIGGTDRKKQIDRLLGLDRFAAAQENVTSLINKIKDMAAEGEKAVAGFDVKGLTEQLARLESEKQAYVEKRAKSVKEFESLMAMEKEQTARLKELRSANEKKNALIKDIEWLRSKIDVLDKEMKDIDKKDLGALTAVAEALSKSEKDLLAKGGEEEETSKKEREAQALLAKTTAELERVHKDVVERDRLDAESRKLDRKALQGDLERLTKGIQELEQECAECTAQKKESEKWLAELEKHISKCPVCEREMDDEMLAKLREAKKALAKESESTYKGASERLIKARAERSERERESVRAVTLGERLEAYGQLDKKLSELMEKLEKEKAAFESSSKQREAIIKAIKDIGDSVRELRTRKEHLERRERLAKQSAESSGSLKLKEAEASEIKVDDMEMDKAQRAYTEIKERISSLSTEVTMLEHGIREKDAQVRDKKEEMARVEKLKSDVAAKRAAQENLILFKNSLEDAQVVMRNRLISSINNVMQEVWPELYPYGDYKGLSIEATDGDYVLKVMTDVDGKGVWERVDSIASGGERSIACLSMRVAFALVLVPNLKWLILDEPTHNIDQQGIQKFVRVFNEQLPRIVDQIFIITHDETLKQVSNAKIYVLNRDKEASRETVVQEL